MEEAPLIPLSFHLPIPLRHPSSSDISPNILSRSPSNRNPRAAKPSPLASTELCKDLAQSGLISPCSNLQGPRKSCMDSASPCPTWQGRAAQGPGVPHPVWDQLGLPSTPDCRQQADQQTALPPSARAWQEAAGSLSAGTALWGQGMTPQPPQIPQQAGCRQGAGRAGCSLAGGCVPPATSPWLGSVHADF